MSLKFTNVSSLRNVFKIRLEGYIGDWDGDWYKEEIVENTPENQETIEKLLNLLEVGFSFDNEAKNREFNRYLEDLHQYLYIPQNEHNMTIVYYDNEGHSFNVELDK